MAWNADEDRGGREGERKPFALELTEQDPALALRGFIISRTGVLPTDPTFRDLCANEELLQFTAYWLQKKETDFFNTWGKLLGVVWTEEQVRQMSDAKPKATAPKEMFVPLALAVNGDLFESLKKSFRVQHGPYIGGGEYQSDGREEVVELGDLPPEEFLQWANQATGVMQEVSENFSKQHELTIKDGRDQIDDPRLQRARDQIRQSKRFR